MRKIIALVILGAIGLSACGGLKLDCQNRQQRVAHVAAIADKELVRGYGPYEVRAILGQPDDVITYQGGGGQEVWKYNVLDDCRTIQGLGAPTTELIFQEGVLQRWITYTP